MAAPSNTVAPVVFGSSVAVKFVLYADTGTWSNAVTYAYQWMRGGINIPLATGGGYELTADDIGAMMSCRVTATNPEGSSSVISHILGPVFASVFHEEISLVDPTKVLSLVVDTDTYELFEFSYSWTAPATYTVVGGSELGCEYGASELLEELGFRFYASAMFGGPSGHPEWGTVRPATITEGLTQTQTEYWFHNNSLFLAYGHRWIPFPPTGPSAPNAPPGIYGHNEPDSWRLQGAQTRWAILNGFNTSVYPAGHRWLNVVSNNKGFFANYPQLLKHDPANPVRGTPEDTGPSYDLANVLPATADFTRLVNINASHLLRDGLGFYRRTHFDPVDGDQNISNNVYPFTQAVAEAVRTGTPAISWPAATVNGISYPAGSVPAMPGVSDGRIGIYAYAGHRIPPTTVTEMMDGVYVQVALAFNNAAVTGFTYQELVAAYGEISEPLFLREYWDTQAWSNGLPFTNGRMKEHYFDGPGWYDDFYASGARGINTEYGANWLCNIVGTRAGIRKCKTGTGGTYAEAVDDLMLYLFRKPSDPAEEDLAVRELLEYWGSGKNNFNRYNIRRSCDFVAAMEDGWYKTLFEQHMVFCKKRMYLPLQIAKANNPSWPAPAPGDPFPAAFTSYMKNVVAMRLQENIHCYAQVRRDANGWVQPNYPALWWGRYKNTVGASTPGYPTFDTGPDWYCFPELPTHEEFTAAHAQLLADTPYDTELASEDLVLVRGITSTTGTPTTQPDSPHFFTIGAAPYAFVGPGTVIFTAASGGGPVAGGDVITQSYGHGVHFFTSPMQYTLASNQGGELFLDTFGGVRRDSHVGSGFEWMYFPTRCCRPVKDVDMEANPRWTFWDRYGPEDDIPVAVPPAVQAKVGDLYRLDLGMKSAVGYVSPKNLGPGQVLIDNINTRGDINNTAANRWLSKKQTIALLPRVIADEDFPNRARVAIA